MDSAVELRTTEVMMKTYSKTTKAKKAMMKTYSKTTKMERMRRTSASLKARALLKDAALDIHQRRRVIQSTC